MKTCYIAGPMRGIPHFNFPAFDEARDRLQQEGWRVISPADMDRDAGFSAELLPHTTEFSPAQNRVFFDRDSAALSSLRAERGDAIFFLPGWENSTGAMAEFAMGRWLKLSLIDYPTRINMSSLRPRVVMPHNHPLTEHVLQQIGQGERL